MARKSTMARKIIAYTAIAALVIFSILLLQKLPDATLENCALHKGEVVSVSDGGSQDIVIRLKDNKYHFYINRGVASGLTVEDLNKKLLNKPVELLTIIPSNPFNRGSIGAHIAQVKYRDTVIYSEL